MNVRQRGFLVFVASWLCLQLGSTAHAQEGTQTLAEGGHTAEVKTTSTHIKLETNTTTLSTFTIDNLGTRSEQGWWTDSRLVVGTTWQWSGAEIDLELELFSPNLFGQTSDLGTRRGTDTLQIRRDADALKLNLIPQKLQLTQRLSFGTLKVRHQSYGWGHGLLARSGQEEPDFGWSKRNNLVERVAFGTTPFVHIDSLPTWLRTAALFATTDCIYRDDNADLIQGDMAWAAAVGMKTGSDTWQAGILQSWRFQKDRFDPNFPEGQRSSLAAWTHDIFVTLPLSSSHGQRLVWAMEAALILGSTTRPQLQETFEDGATIRATGALTRLEYAWQDALTVKLEAGYASGDNDPRDDVYRNFSFHSDHTVGTVLFDHVIPLLTARSVDRIHDPALVDQAPASTRFLVNQGTVQNARYIYPVITWNAHKTVKLRAAYLLAGSAGDFIDAYQSGILGGYNHNYDSTPSSSRFLGQEISLSARISMGDSPRSPITLTAEGGILLPGSALASVQPNPVSLMRANLSLPW